MTTAKTPEERERNARYQREYRARRAEQQATEVRGIFAHPDDHADPEVRERVRSICQSLPARSLSGVRLDIDANMNS